MQISIKRLAFLAIIALAVLLTGCVGAPSAAPGAAVTATFPAATATVPPTAAIPLTGPTAVLTPGAPVVSTSMAVTSVPVMPTGMGMPTEAVGPTQAGTPVITLANNGGSIALHPGDRFVLSLGEMYDWTITLSDPNVLHRVINITPVRGSQGVYEAGGAGSTVLTAAGDPHCRQSQPPCAMPSVSFELNVTVSP
jgi:hypothetical protein